MSEIRRFPSEQRVAKFYLETRAVARRSLTDYERRAGCPRADGDREDRALRQVVVYDAEATLLAVERALAGIHDEWCGVLLVCLGWGALVDPPPGHPERGIRDGPWMERAELPARWSRLPAHLTRHGLWARRLQFREALGREGVLDGGEVEAWAAVEKGEYEGGDVDGKMLRGWKAIAEFLGCHEETAQSYETEGLPVARVRRRVIADPDRLRAWIESQRRAEPGAA